MLGIESKSDHVNNSSILSFAKAGAELQVLAGVPRLGSPLFFWMGSLLFVSTAVTW